MTIPVIIFWLTALGLMVSTGPGLIYFYFFAGAFYSLAVLPPALMGGASLVAQPVASGLLAVWVACKRGALQEMLAAAIDIRRFGLLTGFVLYACVTAFILPQLFEGQVRVVPVAAGQADTAFLRPTSQNITQSGYICLSLLTALTFYRIGMRYSREIYIGLCICGVALVLTGLLDLATKQTGILSSFRTAGYATLADVEVEGFWRVVGLMPEASSYGGACAAMAAALYFLRGGSQLGSAMVIGSSCLVVVLLAMAFFSLSSTAYLTLMVFVVLAAINWTRRLIARRGKASMHEFGFDLSVILLALGVATGMLMFKPDVLTPYIGLVDELIFNKQASESFAERSMWNAVGMDALSKTGGLGVGMGGHRSSSWLVAILSNTGIVGAVIMALFLLQTFFRSPPEKSEFSVQRLFGAKAVIALGLLSMSIAGTMPDPGVLNAAFMGLACAWSSSGETRSAWRAPYASGPDALSPIGVGVEVRLRERRGSSTSR